MTSNEIRSQFLQFFESKGHHIVPSAPMVVKNDPTLMFTNAGMNQFKDIFLGNANAPYPRVSDAQKCLRVSGKHNDLEEVGHDTYHHTMFEMLGNWSFGDYFKKEAIAYGWEFLTEVMHIDKANLYVTVFGGDEKDGLAMDTEAYNFWKEHIDESRILKGSKKDNFWEMGEQGPCGPCSEIHIDLRDESEKQRIPGRDLVNKDNPLVIEIWNLVFMQYNRLANGTLEPLKAKHIDTGMGFERLCMVMQGKKSNYDTDVFQPLIQEIAHMSGRAYGQDEKADIAMRVIADHLRAVSFSIADGQLPSNAKAGYVIRRILRRAVRYGYTFLGFELFDTYGFPIDLTQLMATEKGWTVDMEGFQQGLAEQKNRSRAAAAVENDDWVELIPGTTQEFIGYDSLNAEVRITRYRHVKVKDKEFYQLVFDRTPFYGESGGQVGDQGTLTHSSGDMIPVINTKKENNLIIHIVAKLPEHLDQPYKAEVDKCRRFAIECNHTSTHLLHKALRNVLGKHVEQKGSSVDDQRLRFDFSHFAKLTREEIREVEKQVNIDIRHAIALEEHRAMPIAEALKLGAMALFGEKYGDHVRVIKFGDSVEFCGGTHISNTGHIGSFRIVSEGAVAAGMRRIEAVTGAAAEMYNNNMQDQLESLRELLKNPKDIIAAVQRLQDDNAALHAQVEQFQKEQINALRRDFAAQLEQNPLLVRKMDGDLSQLKDAMLSLAAQYPDMAVVLGSLHGGKPALLVALGQNRINAGLNASTIVRTAGKEMQGGGGGQPAYATAGGKNPDGLDQAMQVAAKQIG